MFRKSLLTLGFLAAFVTSLATTPDVQSSLLDAVTLFEGGAADSAKVILSGLHAADSTNDAVCYYLGMCELAAGNVECAASLISAAVSLDSSNVWYRNALCEIYLGSNRSDKAIPLVRSLLKSFPQSYNTPYFLSLLADYELDNHRDSLALSYYDRALEMDPCYAPAQMGKAETYRMRGNLPAFFVSLSDVVHNSSVVSAAKSNYMTALMDHIDSKFWWVWGAQMTSLIDDLERMHPDDMDALWLKMRIFAIERDWDGVINQCGKVAALAASKGDDENLTKAWSTIGDILHQEKNDEQGAFKMYERVLKVDPEYVSVLNNYAYYLSLKGKSLRKALKMSAVTIDKEPDNATYLDTYGWILHLLRRDAEAKPCFKRALIYGGRDNKEVLWHYSEVLKSLGENDLSDYYRMLSGRK